MRYISAVKGTIIAFIVFSLSIILLPTIEFPEGAETLLTVSTFLFAILVGFFFARLSSRYDKIRELVAAEDAQILSLYKTSQIFGKDFSQRIADLIDDYYTRAYDLTLNQNTYKPTMPIFFALWDEVINLPNKQPEAAYQALIDRLSEIEQSRNLTASIA
jgi:hypothetical protein